MSCLWAAPPSLTQLDTKPANSASLRLRLRGITLDITGPPNGLTSHHVNRAAAAPVHVVVRQPSKSYTASRLRMRRSDPTAAPALSLPPRRLRGGRSHRDMRQ